MVQSDAELFRQRGFGKRLGFGERPAVIVIDIVKAFTNPAAPLGTNLDSQIAATNAILDVAHAGGYLVIFTTTGYYDEIDMRDAGVWAQKIGGLTSLKAGTDGPELDPRLKASRGDPFLVKKYASCFFGTDLVSRLTAARVDTLILTGCTTSGCVRATAVDGVQYGFRPIVVREGVGDRSAAAHEQSLFDLDAKYADVVGLADAIAYLKGGMAHRTATAA